MSTVTETITTTKLIQDQPVNQCRTSTFSIQFTPLISSKTRRWLENISPMLPYIFDWANMTTLAGLCCAILGTYFVALKQFSLGMCFICISVICDWMDGWVARHSTERPKAYSDFGAQLDTLADIISFGIFPSVTVLSFSNYKAYALPFCIIFMIGCAVRLAYFNMSYTSCNGNLKHYTGLTVDNNGMAVASAFLFKDQFKDFLFSIIICLLLFTLSVLNMSKIRIPKITSGFIWWSFVIANAIMAFVHGINATSV